MRTFTLFAALAVMPQAVLCDRTINWYISIDASNKTQNEANAAAVQEHISLFSQLQLSWSPGFPDNGSLSGWDNEAAVNSWLSVYKPLNLPIIPVVVDMTNATTFRTFYADPTGYANKLVAIGKRYNFAGFNFDYEPEYPTDTHAQDYADFLKAVNTILVANGFTLSIWVAQWSQALNKYGILADSGVQFLQDMETYGGQPMPTMLGYLHQYVDSIKSARGNLEQAGVGLGPYQTTYWNPANLKSFVHNATVLGVTNLDIFRLLMDGKNDWPPAYWWDVLGKFMKGEI